MEWIGWQALLIVHCAEMCFGSATARIRHVPAVLSSIELWNRAIHDSVLSRSTYRPISRLSFILYQTAAAKRRNPPNHPRIGFPSNYY